MIFIKERVVHQISVNDSHSSMLGPGSTAYTARLRYRFSQSTGKTPYFLRGFSRIVLLKKMSYCCNAYFSFIASKIESTIDSPSL